MKEVYIIKNTGERELFDPLKLEASLRRSKASAEVVADILQRVQKKLRNNMTTTAIYKMAFDMLRKKERTSAIRYSVRRSVLDLGPSGFPFEKFIAKLYEAKGYKTLHSVMLQGHCVEHEIDVVAYNEKEVIVMEVKFHNQLSIKTDTKVALYIKARFDDLRDQPIMIDGKERTMTQSIIITNTQFTETAITYGNCNGITMISWDYPQQDNLYDMIEETGLHPLTCVTQLSKKQKQDLLTLGIVNCKGLKGNEDAMKSVGISPKKITEISKDLDIICNHNHS